MISVLSTMLLTGCQTNIKIQCPKPFGPAPTEVTQKLSELKSFEGKQWVIDVSKTRDILIEYSNG